MATWVRSLTGTAPSITNGSLTGTVSLNNATAPADFNPAAVNSVRIQYTVAVTSGTFSGSETHTVHRAAELSLSGASDIATVNLGNTTLNNATPSVSVDSTDSTIPIRTLADWEAANLNPWGNITTNWTTFNQDMGPDGVTVAITAATVTIDYTVATRTQEAFRIRLDGTALNTDGGWSAAQDTNVSLEAEQTIRLRFRVSDTGASSSTGYQLRYSRNGGAYTALPVQATPVGTGVTPATIESTISTGFTDDDAITSALLTGATGSFVNGRADEASNTTSAISLSPNQYTELEFAVRIRKYYWTGSAVADNVDGTTFDFRVYTSAGTALEAYSVTPRVTVDSAGLVGGTWPEAPHHLGPIVDTNGNMYFFMESWEDKVSGGWVVALKSTDGGLTWAAQDIANGPGATAGTDDWEGASVVQDNQTTGRVFLFSHHNTTVEKHIFFTSDHATTPDQWGTVGTVVDTFGAVLNSQQWVAATIRSDGDLILLYNEGSGTDNLTSYTVSTDGGANWSAPANLDGTTGRSIYNAWPVMAESDLCYIFYHDNDTPTTDTAHVFYKTLSSTGTLTADGSRVQVSTNNLAGGAGQRGAILGAAYYDDAGVEVVTVVWVDSNQATPVAVARSYRDASPQSIETVSGVGVAEGGLSGSNQYVGAVAVHASGKSLHVLYADETTTDVFYDTEVDDGGWGTDTELEDGVDALWVRANVVSRSGTPYLGYVYDNGTGTAAGGQGPVYYSEVALSASAVELDGTTSGVATVTAALKIERRLQSSTSGVATVTASLSVTRQFAGITSGSSTVSGDLERVLQLTGASTGLASISGALSQVQELDTSSAGSSTVSGALSQVQELSGTVAGQATVSGNMALVIELAATTSGAATVSGDLERVLQLASSPAGVATVTGDIDATDQLLATVAGTSTVTASLTVLGTNELAGTIASIATVVGDVDVTDQLATTSAGVATVSGDLELVYQLESSPAGVATVTGKLFGHSAVGHATVTATLTVTSVTVKELAGTPSGTSTVTAALTIERHLAGTLAGVGSVSGNLTQVHQLAATTSGQATVSAQLQITQQLAATSSGTSTVSGDIDVYDQLAGSIAGTSTVSATLQSFSAQNFAGTIAGTSTVSATLLQIHQLAGTTAGAGSVTGQILLTRQLQGSTTGQGSVTGDFDVQAQLEGSVAGTSSITGDLEALVELEGSISGASQVQGNIVTVAELEATTSGVATISATLTNFGVGQLAGTPSGTSTVTADLEQVHNLATTSTGVATVTGQITQVPLLQATSAGMSAVTGQVTQVHELAATSSGQATVSGTIDVISQAEFAGTTSGVATVSADIDVTDQLASTVAGVATVTADIDVYDQLAGTIAGQASVAGSLDVTTVLAGSSSGQATITGAITQTHELSAVVTGLSNVEGALVLVGQIELEAQSNGTATVSGVLTTISELDGASVGAALVSGQLQNVAGVSGASSGTSTVSATLLIIHEFGGTITGSATVTGVLTVPPTRGFLDISTSLVGGLSTSTRLVGGASISTATVGTLTLEDS